MTTVLFHLNGAEATASQLAPLAFAGFAHFTAMQVRGGCVRGLDLHLRRLHDSSIELFGSAVPDERILDHLKAAMIRAPRDVSLSCYIFPSADESSASTIGADGASRLDVLVRVTEPQTPKASSISLDLVSHQRHLAHIKHVGEIAKTQFMRLARSRGFDDAAFIDDRGRLSEATIWNLAFWDSETVIWPRADVLPGVTSQILVRQLATLGISQIERPIVPAELTARDLAGVVMNSWTPGIPIGRLGDIDLSSSRRTAGAPGTGQEDPMSSRSGEFTRLLHRAYVAEVPVPLV